ncbi:MAG: hypothetical protein ACYDDI_15915 [Candidatus Acidiferrales bacterium]
MRSIQRSPTLGLFLGLIITLAAVVAYSAYITRQISGLRELQNNLAGRYRKDLLQLLRIQNDLNSLGLALRDMLANDEPYPLNAWSAQFQQIHTDLDDALRTNSSLPWLAARPANSEFGEFLCAILGRCESHFRSRAQWQWKKSARTDPHFAPGPAGLFDRRRGPPIGQ